MKKIKYILASFLLLGSSASYAQVGIINSGAKASLHVMPLSTTSSTAEGIIAPNLTRSQLISKDSRYSTAQSGAIVYVTAIDGTATSKTAKVINIGYYYFDGSLWQAIDQPGQYFYLPTFSIPASAIGTGYTFDLYNNVYKMQFIQTGNTSYTTSNSTLSMIPAGRYAATELDYVVTYYDQDVIKINSISASGVINYNVISTLLGPGSFINVVLITKR
ncbi:hypothetical protein [Dysgonomonas macrotermitis]|uniref:DUF4397 domain-containing protein n=1 Tax=Dysgonomonas macrotermitis TaxID=1346286 RepID=A0A1M5GG88_9BACT|nr:hypothetical protein [Dysgonomonas macrotermitis]SHG02733.1 hypothetical protein SAMN05444362_1142 [Dysgonomonas macrotermitis]